MSTGFLEETDLRDFDMGQDPPCEIKYIGDPNRVCGKPSVVRVKFDCEACGDTATRFVCGPHYDDLKNGKIACRACLSVPVNSWTVI